MLSTLMSPRNLREFLWKLFWSCLWNVSADSAQLKKKSKPVFRGMCIILYKQFLQPRVIRTNYSEIEKKKEILNIRVNLRD